MKRKATDELIADRPLPIREGGQTSAETGFIVKAEELDTSAGGDADSQDGHTAPSEEHSTPVTTAHSTTASRRFPSDLKTIHCNWPNCSKTFNRPARLTAHLRSHTNDRPFKCPDCDKAYLEEKHLRQHIKGSHTHERRYVCDECDKAFLTATRLRRHAAVHEGQDRFRCRGYDETCTRTFRKHQTLQRHIRVDHLNQPAFACSHEITPPIAGSSTNSPPGPSRPSKCNAVFDSAGALRRHVEREHAAPKFWCEECAKVSGSSGTGFATRQLLEAHMRHEHVNCPFCDEQCAGPSELHKHVDMYHSGKSVADRKTIVCPHDGCGKTFTRRANLNVHIRAAHEGLRFVCGGDDVAADTVSTSGIVSSGGGGSSAPNIAAWDARAEGCGRSFVSKMKLEEHILYVHLGCERPAPPLLIQKTPAGSAAVPSVSRSTLGLDNNDTGSPAGAPANFNAVALGETPAEDSIIDALLGTNRTLVCTVAGCTARFVRHHDLNVHIQRDHAPGSHGAEVGADDETSNAFNPDEFWIGGGDNMDADNMFDEYFDMDANLHLSVSIGDAGPQLVVNNDPQWQVEEAEMRMLIGNDDASGEGAAYNNAAFLDPNLFL